MFRAADELRLMLTAVRYFTRLPVPQWVTHSDSRLSGAMRHFPLVGVFVGLLTGMIFLGALRFFQKSIAVLLAMLAGVLLTGGFHEDGLADTCDGFGGGWNKAQILAVMKDSRIGSYGVLGLAFGFAFKFAALSAIPVAQFLSISVAAHSFSRFMAVTTIAAQRYVRDDDAARARQAVRGISHSGLASAAIVAIIPIAWLGAAGAAGAVAAIVLRLLLGRYFLKRIGGYTGDCLGAIQQVTEIGFYLALLAWIST